MRREDAGRVEGVRWKTRQIVASMMGVGGRINVYLCIKQALFIRPMNMHCLVAVARCRVQTRRYHCLINHTQSQWQPAPAPCELCKARAAEGTVSLSFLSEW